MQRLSQPVLRAAVESASTSCGSLLSCRLWYPTGIFLGISYAQFCQSLRRSQTNCGSYMTAQNFAADWCWLFAADWCWLDSLVAKFNLVCMEAWKVQFANSVRSWCQPHKQCPTFRSWQAWLLNLLLCTMHLPRYYLLVAARQHRHQHPSQCAGVLFVMRHACQTAVVT